MIIKPEITLFTCGDSRDISTWSNVPYLFAKTLESKGYTLHRIDISPNKVLNRLFNTSAFIIFKKCLKLKACPEFHRTRLHRFIIYRRIKKATRKYPNTSLNLFLSFAFYNKYSNKPSILWCDWTDRIVIERLGRKPAFYEEKSLRHEDYVMQKADLVYTMFPVCKEHMEELYGRKIVYLNRNVVNTVFNGEFNIENTIKNRYKSNTILFIGGIKYIGAAKELIKSVKHLNKDTESYKLHIIGITNEQIKNNDENIICHGYLRKNIERERILYYQLLHSCKVLVNPAQQWGGYSSCIEAMFYGTPIIVAPYDDFVKEFSRDINFGYYYNGKNLIDCIEKVLYAKEDEYRNLCINANKLVKDYTWNNYINDFLNSLKEENVI